MSIHRRRVPVADADAAEQVVGRMCVGGHSNAVHRRYCSTCGVDLVARGGQAGIGARPVLGVLIRGDGLRHAVRGDFSVYGAPLSEWLAGSGPADRVCPRVRVLVLGWEPYVLVETPDVFWISEDGERSTLEEGESRALLSSAALQVGADTYRWEPLDVSSPADPHRRRRRRSRLPDRELFL